jgi:secreted PhoX family phosphatase
MNRREFLRMGGAFGARVVLGSSLFALGCDLTFYGPLEPPDENGIRLPKGFRSRVLARQGTRVADTAYLWPPAPDGGAVFCDGPGWIYVANSESFPGGASALRFDPSGRVVDAYSICGATRLNCAGGATPWGTWLSCEEVADGRVFECDPQGVSAAAARPALGLFQHEAVAVDPVHRRLYLTEDRPDGRLYRFTPNRWEQLDAGVLEVALVDAAGFVTWQSVTNPTPALGQTPTRLQVPASRAFNGGEGIVWSAGRIFFVTKGDNRIYELDLATSMLRVLYAAATDALAQLRGVDNITVSPRGDLVVAEDGGNMELVFVTSEGVGLAFLRVEGQPFSELTGPAFDPSGQRLYFNSQRGPDGRGLTYEVRGPFRSLRRHALERQPAQPAAR